MCPVTCPSRMGFLFVHSHPDVAQRSNPVRRFVHVLAVLALFVTLAPVSAQSDETLDRAIEYIKTQQQADGSFAGISAGSTADALFALAAAGEDVLTVAQNGVSAIEYINTQGDEASQSAGLAAKYAIALLLADQPITLADGTDLIEVVENAYNDETNQYGDDITAHAYALIALNAAGRDVPAPAIEALQQLQGEDGGWSFDAESGSDTNTTSLAVQALVAAGDERAVIDSAVEYYRSQQNDDGGFPYSQASEYGTDSDANSTALSMQALLAAGENLDDWAQNGNTPLDRLIEFQNESGAFRYQDAMPDDNPFATYQAVPAIAGETLPLEVVEGVEQPAASPATEATTAEALPSPETSPSPETTATAEPTTEPETTPEAAAHPTVITSPESPALPTASPTDEAQALPETGQRDLAALYALIAGALLALSGLAIRRRT